LQAGAFRERREYVLPVRFDNTDLPGLNETAAYIDGCNIKPNALVQLIADKLKAL